MTTTERHVVLVCGGRDFRDGDFVRDTLNAYHAAYPITRLVCGAASGADSMASSWANRSRVAVAEYPADWFNLGRRAGPLRNQQMLDVEKPDAVIAFPGGAGTADMKRRAERARVPVIEYTQRPPDAGGVTGGNE